MKLSIAFTLLAACAGEAPRSSNDDPIAPAPADDVLPPSSIAVARALIDGAPHLIAVTGETDEGLAGFDLGVLEGSALERVREATLEGIALETIDAPRVTVPRSALLPPVDTIGASINVAENYVDHAAETGTGAAAPYLFPKVAATTPADSRVAASSAELLDYEVELCMVVGESIASPDQLAGALKGFFLCNDLSDRAIQIREADPDAPQTAKGFTDAKSKPGYLPTGPFMVVTRQPMFDTELELAVNGEPRQQAAASEMVMAPAGILEQTLALAGQPNWTYQGSAIPLIATGEVPAGTLFVTGTPGGVVFAPPSQLFKLEALVDYAQDGGPLTGMGPEEYVREAYVAHEKASGRYLAAGDQITARATGLGQMTIAID